MNKDQFLSALANNYNKGLAVLEIKNAAYSGNGDPFKNFKLAQHVGLTAEQGILLRMGDKIARCATLINNPSTPTGDESLQDTLLDLMNYANLLSVFISSGRE